MDRKINSTWEGVAEIIKIIAEEVQRRSRARIVNKEKWYLPLFYISSEG